MSHLNMSNTDRMLGTVLGLVLIGLALSGAIGWWGCVGIAPLLTGFSGTCPLYRVERPSRARRTVQVPKMRHFTPQHVATSRTRSFRRRIAPLGFPVGSYHLSWNPATH